MNTEPDFEVSADMRLIELQRVSLGLATPQPTAWQTRLAPEPGAATLDDVQPPVGRSAVLAVQASATPPSGVIPGAVVTVSLSVANEGAASARKVAVVVPIPAGAGFRPGSFVQDGRPMADETADQFFHDGLDVGEIAPGDRKTFVWKLGVRLGNNALLVIPTVRAGGAAVVGARNLKIDRKGKSVAAFAAELERAGPGLYAPKPLIPVEIPADELPFYELDEQEIIVHEAANAALSPARPQPVVVEPQPQSEPQREPEPQPAPVSEPQSSPEPEIEPPAPPAPEPEPPLPEPQREPEPEPKPERASEPPPEPEPVAPPVREAVMLYGRFDRTTIAFFDRTFNGSKVPTILSHCIFGSALACSTDGIGNDGLGLKRHLDAQSQVLHRMQLHERLGKKEPIAEYAGELLANLSSIRPAAIEEIAPPKDVVLLQTELSEPTLAVLAKINEGRARWDFVKARQLTLALQAQRIAGIASDSAAGAALENALRVYAQTAMTTLQKLFVRLRIDRTTGVLFQTDAQLDAAARALVTAFANAAGQ